MQGSCSQNCWLTSSCNTAQSLEHMEDIYSSKPTIETVHQSDEVTFAAQLTPIRPKPSYLTRICMEKTSIYQLVFSNVGDNTRSKNHQLRNKSQIPPTAQKSALQKLRPDWLWRIVSTLRGQYTQSALYNKRQTGSLNYDARANPKTKQARGVRWWSKMVYQLPTLAHSHSHKTKWQNHATSRTFNRAHKHRDEVRIFFAQARVRQLKTRYSICFADKGIIHTPQPRKR